MTVRKRAGGIYHYVFEVGGRPYLTLHRAYSSKLKRFIHPDPLGIDGGVNVYMWANMNPLAFVDPYGLEAMLNAIARDEWGNLKPDPTKMTP